MFASKKTSTEFKKVKPNIESKDWKPLKTFTIYLDIVNNSIIAQKLTEDITELGGTVETFLNKNVKYLVTNRRNWKLNIKDSSCENSLTCTPSSLNSASRSSTMTADSPWTGDSSSSKIIINKTVKSRADTLLERANKSVKYAEDVLQMATRLGIRILHLSQFSIWLKKLKMKSKPHDIQSAKMVGKEISKVKLSTTNSSRTKLALPFFKFEDDEGRYCPQYRQFQVWPLIDVNVFHDQSPFRKISSNKCFKGLVPNRNSPLKQSPKHQSPKLANISKASYTKRSPACSLGNKPGYCDICSVRYTNIYEHVTDKKHQEIVREPLFYSKLDKYISTLPTLKQLQEKYGPSIRESFNTRSPLALMETNGVKEGVLNSTFNRTISPETLDKSPYYSKKGENCVARKKLRLETGIQTSTPQSHFVSSYQNILEEKENAIDSETEIETGKYIKTPEKKPFQVKRSALQQIQNATFCNMDNVINEQQNNMNGEEETLCFLKNTPSRLLRSTSQRRSLSCNTVGESSSNSPVTTNRDVSHHSLVPTIPYEEENNMMDHSHWDQLEPLNLSVKLSLEDLVEVGDHVELDATPFPLVDDTRYSKLEETLHGLNICHFQPNQNEVLDNEQENFFISPDLEDMIKEEDNNWDMAVESFISNKVNVLQSEADTSCISASILTG